MRAPLHVVPLVLAGEHRADRLCPCGPEPMRDLLEPSRTVYVHRIATPTADRAPRGRPETDPPFCRAHIIAGPSRSQRNAAQSLFPIDFRPRERVR